jgi:hypothetical protein
VKNSKTSKMKSCKKSNKIPKLKKWEIIKRLKHKKLPKN